MTALPDPFRLDNEIALITGGGTGLGLGIATAMVRAGARVVLTGRREEPLRDAVKTLGDAATYVCYDVTDFASAPPLFKKIESQVGHPTILVNNAGNHLKKPAEEITVDQFRALLDTHVLGAHALVREVLPGMLARRHGVILFTASMASLYGLPLTVAYSAAKSAYLGIVRTLATEVSSRGVRVNAIAPGFIETAIVRGAFAGDPARRDKVLNRTPMNRLGEVHEVGNAAVFLCSPAASFITGAVLPVDGGVSIGF